jgi:hypothetical protein
VADDKKESNISSHRNSSGKKDKSGQKEKVKSTETKAAPKLSKSAIEEKNALSIMNDVSVPYFDSHVHIDWVLRRLAEADAKDNKKAATTSTSTVTAPPSSVATSTPTSPPILEAEGNPSSTTPVAAGTVATATTIIATPSWAAKESVSPNTLTWQTFVTTTLPPSFGGCLTVSCDIESIQPTFDLLSSTDLVSNYWQHSILI